MAPLNIESRVTAGALHAVLGAITTQDTWRGHPTTDLMLRLLDALGPDDGGLISVSLGECLLPLRLDAERQRIVLDVIRGFDLHEAWPGLAVLLRHAPTQHATLVGAALATNPAVPDDLTAAVEQALRHLHYDEDLQRQVRVIQEAQLPEGSRPLEAAVLRERWPGRVGAIGEVPDPMAVVSDNAGTAYDVLRLAVELRSRGVQVRRITSSTFELPPGWAPRWALIVAAAEPPEGMSLDQTFKTRGSLAPSTRRDVLRRMNKMFRGRLDHPEVRADADDFAGSDPLYDVEVFLQGALLPQEAILLTGWSAQTIRNRSSRYEVLRPRYVAHTPYFTFAQLTALRVERYLSKVLRKRVSEELAAKIMRDTQLEERVPTHVTGDGRVLFEQHGSLVEEGGQMTFHVVAMDEVVRSFDLGGGRTAPELLQPSSHTRVHPLISHGSPTVEMTRVPVTAVRDVMAIGRDAGMSGAELIAYARGYYPSLSSEQIHDADALGIKIAA